MNTEYRAWVRSTIILSPVAMCFKYHSLVLKTLGMDFEEAYPDTCSSVGMAARTGNVQQLKFMIKMGKPVDVKDNRGWQSLHEAAYHGHIQCLKLILKHGADVDCRTFEEQTPLMFACKRGHHDCVDYLLKKGANPNSKTLELLSPLWEAVQMSSQCVDLLLKSGAEVNAQTYTEETALHRALYHRDGVDKHMIRSLLEYGADLSMQDENGLTPLFLASQFGQFECLKIFIEHAQLKGDKTKEELVNKTANDNASPLYLAVQNNATECAKLLLANGADPNKYITCDDIKIYPLHVALMKENIECTELLARITDPEIFSWDNYSCEPSYYPLVIACSNNSNTFLKILLRQPNFRRNMANYENGMLQLLCNFDLLEYEMKIKPTVLLYKFYESAVREMFYSGIFISVESEARMNQFRQHKNCFPYFLLALRLGAKPQRIDIMNLEGKLLLTYWCAIVKYASRSCKNCAPEIGSTREFCCRVDKFTGDFTRAGGVRTLLSVISPLSYATEREESIKKQTQQHFVEVINIDKIFTLQNICRRKVILCLLRTGNFNRQSVFGLNLPSSLHSFMMLEDTACSDMVLDSFEELDQAEKYLDKLFEEASKEEISMNTN